MSLSKNQSSSKDSIQSTLFSFKQLSLLEVLQKQSMQHSPNSKLVLIYCFIHFLVPFFCWPYLNRSEFYLVGGLSLIAITLSIFIHIKNLWPSVARPYFPLTWYLAMLYIFPTISTTMLLATKGSQHWTVYAFSSLLFLAFLTQWKNFLILIFLGSILGTAIFLLFIGDWDTFTYSYKTLYLQLYQLLIALFMGKMITSLVKKNVSIEVNPRDQLARMLPHKSWNPSSVPMAQSFVFDENTPHTSMEVDRAEDPLKLPLIPEKTLNSILFFEEILKPEHWKEQKVTIALGEQYALLLQEYRGDYPLPKNLKGDFELNTVPNLFRYLLINMMKYLEDQTDQLEWEVDSQKKRLQWRFTPHTQGNYNEAFSREWPLLESVDPVTESCEGLPLVQLIAKVLGIQCNCEQEGEAIIISLSC